MLNKTRVTVSSAQEMIKDIRILALRGKNTFMKYLYEPLLDAGWKGGQQVQDRRTLFERLKSDSSDPAFLHTIAPRCKKLIRHSMNDSLSSLGESSIFFLEKMQMHTAVSSAEESLEFEEILTPPLNVFRQISSDDSVELFSETVNSADAENLKSALEPVKLRDNTEKIRLDGKIRRLYENIRIASQYHNILKCRKLLSSYIISYSDDDDYARSDVEKLISALNSRETGFEEELRSTIAIDLYYRITQGVLKGDIRTTVGSIRKYGYIFEGDSNAKYFYDIDRLERILYKIISDKGLWDELKNRRK